MFRKETAELLQTVLQLFPDASIPPTARVKKFETQERRIINDEVSRSLAKPGGGWLRANRRQHIDERQIELFTENEGSKDE